MLEQTHVMFITHRTEKYTEEEQALMALQAGCRWIQIRIKEQLTLEAANRIMDVDRQGAIWCIDDNLDIALQSGAHSLHLGKHDMPVDEAWEIIRQEGKAEGFIVGATANTFEDIVEANRRGASYIGLGPYRFTTTKKNLSPILGVEGYRRIMQQCREAGITLPVFAIGGIRFEDIAPLMQTGISGIAVSSAITQAENPEAEMKRFCEEVNLYI